MRHIIEKSVEIQAPLAQVWRALTDHREFGDWFGVKIDEPFAVGRTSHGHITYPGLEHVRWEAVITVIEPQCTFAFTWHPYAIDPNVDYSRETPTLVEFNLRSTGTGTRLEVRETGFENLPSARLSDALRMNDRGWAEQMTSISSYVESH